MSPIALSIVVPTFGDASRIGMVVSRIDDLLGAAATTYEILVVSDGNEDDTVAVLRRLSAERHAVVPHQYLPNRGKGYAMCYGAARARGEVVAFIDGDGEIDPAHLLAYVRILEEQRADCVIGSKRHPQSQVTYPGMRRLYSRVYQALIAFLFQLDVRDTQVGVKVFRRHVLAAALPRLLVRQYAFDLELLVVVHHLGYRSVAEAPVAIDRRFASTINVPSVVRMLGDTLAIWYRQRVMRYYDHTEHVALADIRILRSGHER